LTHVGINTSLQKITGNNINSKLQQKPKQSVVVAKTKVKAKPKIKNKKPIPKKIVTPAEKLSKNNKNNRKLVKNKYDRNQMLRLVRRGIKKLTRTVIVKTK
jgi:ectoine hydroxylase-related dioxygenase (phytanoyl-CoA dioxygenase family)